MAERGILTPEKVRRSGGVLFRRCAASIRTQ
jgi:hypothetical protein